MDNGTPLGWDSSRVADDTSTLDLKPVNGHLAMNDSPVEHSWTRDDAVAMYGIERWGDGYFSISDDGTVLVSPDPNHPDSVDLKGLVDR